jgi:two-component system, NtrC family, nitrogen regulation sensor histidine kinase NtrY
MAFSNFRLNVAARTSLIVISIAVAIWGWVVAHWLITPIVAGLLAVLLLIELIWYVERSHRDLSGFLVSVGHQDYSVPLAQQNKGRVFGQLEDAYRVLSDEFRRLNIQKAANHQYLEAVVEHVGVALISLDDAGNVVMVNEPARALFGQPLLSARSFARFDPRLPGLLTRLDDGDRDLLRVQRGDDTLQLVLYCTSLTLLEHRHRLISFQNIRDELEKREIESWQKLIRVLTHEIMNSVTPIISLSKLIQETLSGDGPNPASPLALSAGERSDLLLSANAVHSRSSGLLDFVKAYRSFAAVPVPAFADVELRPLLERVRALMADALAVQPVSMDIQCADASAPLMIHADPHQLEQVLINLTRNAIEALADTADPQIVMRASCNDQHRIVIQVIDNGPGIDPVHLENIFVPFFTTKRGGTGVGLSISRQLVQANRGFISVKRGEGGGTIFLLSLPGAAPASSR